MQKFNNPLDKIKIASPCSADWNKMYGDNRKRFCGECKLNVYNLSEMTREEAESFLVNSEGNVCVKFYRQDGTVLTQNCPVGWQKVKTRISRMTTAVFSLIIGFCGGIVGVSQHLAFLKQSKTYSNKTENFTNKKKISQTENSDSKKLDMAIYGNVSNLDEVKFWIFTERFPKQSE